MPAKNFEPESEKQTGNETDTPETIVQTQPVRELTQTDRLNKRLLQSFLLRINQSSIHTTQGASSNSSVANNNVEDEFC